MGGSLSPACTKSSLHIEVEYLAKTETRGLRVYGEYNVRAHLYCLDQFGTSSCFDTFPISEDFIKEHFHYFGAESGKVKTFRIARFLSQKLSG